MSTALDDDAFEAAHATERARRRKAIWIIIGIVTAMLGLIVFAFAQDEAPPDTSDLRVTFKRPPDAQNAYALLTQLTATLPPEPNEKTPEERHYARIFEEKIEDRVAWDQAVVASVLGRYPPELATKVRTALDAPECEAPEIKSYDDRIPEVGRFRSLAITLTRQASLAWHAGDHAQAAELNLLALKLGHRVSQSRGPLITVLTGTTIERIALDAIRRHADSDSVKPIALRHYLAQIADHEIDITDYHTAYKVEHSAFAHTARDLGNQPLSKFTDTKPNKALDRLLALPGVWQPNRTIRWQAECMRAAIKETPAPDYFESVPWVRRAQNITGRILIGITVPSLGKLTTTCHRIRANLRLTQIYVALRLYQLEHDGVLPADLAELVPSYLPAIPLDPFGGQPLRYERSLTTIWSIDSDKRTITTADGDLSFWTPAYRLRFARPPEPPLPPFEEPKEQE